MIRTYHTYMKVSIFIKGCVFIKEKVFFCIKSQEKKRALFKYWDEKILYNLHPKSKRIIFPSSFNVTYKNDDSNYET